MFSLNLRMMMLVGILFGILYVIVTLFMQAMGVTSFSAYVVFAVFIMLIQYMIGPKIVEMTMRIRYIKREDYPWLYEMVRELSRKAQIPMPKIGISQRPVPNAFAFGRSIKDGRVCVTSGIMDLLDRDELKAVLGHEISHLKNRDVLFITFLSVIPMILYRIFFHLVFFGSFSRRRQGGGYTILIGLAAFFFYFITNLLVLYASRIREYFADRGSIALGNSPSSLATALYKLVYGAAAVPREQIREMEGIKAFFLNDLSKARKEIKDLAELDLDRSGTIDPDELRVLRSKGIQLKTSDKLMEVLSTHPNMLKRIKHLSHYSRGE
jgi:heat shock protein HtpX